jgi:tRNA (guanine37-N1)-methyltransferase
MRIDVLTLFPAMFSAVFAESIIGRAQEKGLVQIRAVNFREYSGNKHQSVDDTPYGGGGGMVLKPEPLFAAVEDVLGGEREGARIILMTPQGVPYSQAMAKELSREQRLVIICGHYEGVDERVRQHLATDEISIGDYVLTGGEIPAMAVIDSVVRLLPGVLGNDVSAEEDSFANGLLEYPQYTRPAEFRGLKVPDVLLSGHHENIAKWRKKESLRRTWQRRPDLLRRIRLTPEEQRWLEEIKTENASPDNS